VLFAVELDEQAELGPGQVDPGPPDLHLPHRVWQTHDPVERQRPSPRRAGIQVDNVHAVQPRGLTGAWGRHLVHP
jgi:hypothetical protein